MDKDLIQPSAAALQSEWRHSSLFPWRIAKPRVDFQPSFLCAFASLREILGSLVAALLPLLPSVQNWLCVLCVRCFARL
jgi:hypothetical protein